MKAGRFHVFVPIAVLALAASALLNDAPAGSAGTQRYTNAVTPLLDGAGGKPIGSVAPLAAVTVVSQSGSATHVTIAGFAAANAPGSVFAFADRRIVEVSGFTGKTAPGAVTVDGWVATSALAADQATVMKAASDLYNQKCSTCHSLRPAGDYTANQWPAIMKTQADNAGLDPGQAALITTYLQIQSGK